jgi:hypothetical protein
LSSPAVDHQLRFLQQYPSTIYKHFGLYNKHVPSMDTSLPTPSVVKEWVEHYICRLSQNKYKKWKLSRDIKVLDILVALNRDYDCKGYRKFCQDWRSGTYGRGGLKMQRRLDVAQNEVALEQGIGDETKILTPSREVEEVLCKFVKSIATVETWRERNKFIEVWNDTHFPGVSEFSIRRYVKIGWTPEEYVGWNWVGNENREVKEYMSFVHLDSVRLGYYWDEAWDNVKALLIMDALVDWVTEMLESGQERWKYERENPFYVGFEQNGKRCTY